MKERENITVVFQPIVQVSSKRVIGVEALTRGLSEEGYMVAPSYLFSYAESVGKAAEMDRMCRERALKEFGDRSDLPVLFLNVQPRFAEETAKTFRGVRRKIFLEVTEQGGHAFTETALDNFLRECRRRGIGIVLDNVGSGNSDLSRITAVRPEIVKVDRALVKGIERSSYRQEVFRSVVRMARGIGATVVAQGTSNLDEAVMALKLGADFLQGFYFSGPVLFRELEGEILQEHLNRSFDAIERKVQDAVNETNIDRRVYLDVFEQLRKEVESCGDIDRVIEMFLDKQSEVDCIFILDGDGIQVSRSYLSSSGSNNTERSIFVPAKIGDRHQIKNYFYAVREGIEDPFLSDWYISVGTGSSCRTVSGSYVDESGEWRILCVDFLSVPCSDIPSKKGEL